MAFVFLFHSLNFCYGIFFHFCCCSVFVLLSCLFLVAGPKFCVSILSVSLSLLHFLMRTVLLGGRVEAHSGFCSIVIIILFWF